MELGWLVISIRRYDCGDTGIGKINSVKQIPRGCEVSGNAFATPQAPPTPEGWGKVSTDNPDVFCTEGASVRYPQYLHACRCMVFREIYVDSGYGFSCGHLSRYAAPPRGVYRTAANSRPNRSTRASLTDTLLPHPPRSSDPSSASPS